MVPDCADDRVGKSQGLDEMNSFDRMKADVEAVFLVEIGFFQEPIAEPDFPDVVEQGSDLKVFFFLEEVSHKWSTCSLCPLSAFTSTCDKNPEIQSSQTPSASEVSSEGRLDS
jgi:hypothetical protein